MSRGKHEYENVGVGPEIAVRMWYVPEIVDALEWNETALANHSISGIHHRAERSRTRRWNLTARSAINVHESAGICLWIHAAVKLRMLHLWNTFKFHDSYTSRWPYHSRPNQTNKNSKFIVNAGSMFYVWSIRYALQHRQSKIWIQKTILENELL